MVNSLNIKPVNSVAEMLCVLAKVGTLRELAMVLFEIITYYESAHPSPCFPCNKLYSLFIMTIIFNNVIHFIPFDSIVTRF
jgi:hypothetical protein